MAVVRFCILAINFQIGYDVETYIGGTLSLKNLVNDFIKLIIRLFLKTFWTINYTLSSY